MILKLSGSTAHSEFRRQKLRTEIQTVTKEISDISSRYIYYVKVETALSDAESFKLKNILEDRFASGVELQNSTHTICVVPRLGTVSPWSSKATEILHRCGLSKIQRIERGIEYLLGTVTGTELPEVVCNSLSECLCDRMTQVILPEGTSNQLFEHLPQKPLSWVELGSNALAALQTVNDEIGLALSEAELKYLVSNYQALGRNPTDIELMMFAQANSEHCRHKIFNADWEIDGELQPRSLFSMIRNTTQCNSKGILTAYDDNAAVTEGPVAQRFQRNPVTGEYIYQLEPVHMLMKVETHNHPTAISPFAGAATGSGGEIRDEGATGRGSQTKAGLTGFSVSSLNIPGFTQPWEERHGKPERIVSALEIMLEAPIGGAAFNNEFGRPNLTGYFRTFEQRIHESGDCQLLGYHKPIMIAGGMGNIRAENVKKGSIPNGTPIIVLGGPAMLIGLGGGAASSQASGESSETLDFASVQRDNPEMQRRCQEVINTCCAMQENPIISIHDVGAGGLSNAVPEILHDSQRGGLIEIGNIPSADRSMSPLQVWCNEAQERYVLALSTRRLEFFKDLCKRENCPFAIIGFASDQQHLEVTDTRRDNKPIDIPMSLLFGKLPRLQRQAKTVNVRFPPLKIPTDSIDEMARRVLNHPVVADKKFLITIGDRSITGLVSRDQMVGPWQVAVSDVAVTTTGFVGFTGEAMAMGERSPIAIMSGPSSARMAVGEALTNIAAARVGSLTDIRLSANWMAAAGSENQDVTLFEAVEAIGMDLCPALGIAIPVGKDSLSMKTVWRGQKGDMTMIAPLSVVISAFAQVLDVRKTLTPELQRNGGDTDLVLIDLGQGKCRLGGSVLAQVYKQLGDQCPDLNNTQLFIGFFESIQQLNREGYLLAYHDRSDGGLFISLCEMAFAGRVGLKIDLDELGDDFSGVLFNEELGAVIQIRTKDRAQVLSVLESAGLSQYSHVLGQPCADQSISFRYQGQTILQGTRAGFQQQWSSTSFKIQSIRDNPDAAQQEFDAILDNHDPGLHSELSFNVNDNFNTVFVNTSRPRLAILREQGVNGHLEMAAAFDQVGFTCVDVHMNDLNNGDFSLQDFIGIVACGGFSYGDVLGAGRGWSNAIQFNNRLRDEFAAFFERSDSFGLGVCNGCQMLASLSDMIPGGDLWPEFTRNISEQFEARIVMVEVQDTPSVFFSGMQGSRFPVVVAHGEGRAVFTQKRGLTESIDCLRYIDNYGNHTEKYPGNPNGSVSGVTGFTSTDGRFTIMMPHPERCFRAVQNTWRTAGLSINGPWSRFFQNAREWVA